MQLLSSFVACDAGVHHEHRHFCLSACTICHPPQPVCSSTMTTTVAKTTEHFKYLEGERTPCTHNKSFAMKRKTTNILYEVTLNFTRSAQFKSRRSFSRHHSNFSHCTSSRCVFFIIIIIVIIIILLLLLLVLHLL